MQYVNTVMHCIHAYYPSFVMTSTACNEEIIKAILKNSFVQY